MLAEHPHSPTGECEAEAVVALDAARRKRVVAETTRLIHEAANRYRVGLCEVPVAFDLHGTCAGMYRMDGKGRLIRYNPWIFSRYFEENLRDTVAHEVAHYVVEMIHGRRGVKPHGRQWRSVMWDFGVEPSVRHGWSLDGLPVRRLRRFIYACGCGEHRLTTIRHNRVLARRASYRCRRCGMELHFTKS